MTVELDDIARAVITTNTYMTLGTADARGTPWVTPVYYTHVNYMDFYWVSSPETRHSRNIAERADVSIAIFDSRAPIGAAEAVYMAAAAIQVDDDDELARAAVIFNSSLPEQRRFELDELCPPALFRLYRATVTEHSVLIRGGDPEYGRGADSRMTVDIRE